MAINYEEEHYEVTNYRVYRVANITCDTCGKKVTIAEPHEDRNVFYRTKASERGFPDDTISNQYCSVDCIIEPLKKHFSTDYINFFEIELDDITL